MREDTVRETERDPFASVHPAVTALWFCFVMVVTLLWTEPVCLFLSFLSALLFSLRLRGRKALRLLLFGALPMILLAVLVNPLCNPRGDTPLFLLPWGSPVTLESLIFGGIMGLLLAAAITWFSCFQAVMTPDKLNCLLGKAAPSLALVLTLSLRMLPRLRAQAAAVSEARRSLGRDREKHRLSEKLRSGADALSVLASWSLEDAVETGNSMKARGFGRPGRTSYTVYRFRLRDRLLLAGILIPGGAVLWGGLAGMLSWSCYPSLSFPPQTPAVFFLHLSCLVLGLVPVLLGLRDDLRWAEKGGAR